jgi:hypothetical protein
MSHKEIASKLEYANGNSSQKPTYYELIGPPLQFKIRMKEFCL